MLLLAVCSEHKRARAFSIFIYGYCGAFTNIPEKPSSGFVAITFLNMNININAVTTKYEIYLNTQIQNSIPFLFFCF